MSKASSLEQRAKKKLAELEADLASFKDAQVDLERRLVAAGVKIKDLSANIQDIVLYILNGDKPEPVATGPATKPPSEGDAPHQRRRYTRKAKMTDTGATDEVPVVRAKAKKPEPDTGHWLCDNPNCHASFSAPIVSGKPGNTVESCPFCEETSIHMVRGPWQPTHECLNCGMRYVGQPKACVCKSKLGWKTLTTQEKR